jgi:uncharacterized protein
MTTKEEHIQYIKDHPGFVVDCSHAIFSIEELELLNKYGHWFMALTRGTLEPVTELQKEFILVATRKKAPVSFAEFAWNKYLRRKEKESDPEQARRLMLNYQYEQDTFYNRDMAKQMKKMMSSEMGKNHRL